MVAAAVERSTTDTENGVPHDCVVTTTVHTCSGGLGSMLCSVPEQGNGQGLHPLPE